MIMSNRCQFGELAWKEAGRAEVLAQEALRQNNYQAYREMSAAASALEIIRRACGSCDSAGFFYPVPEGETRPACQLNETQITTLGSIAASELQAADLLEGNAAQTLAIAEPSPQAAATPTERPPAETEAEAIARSIEPQP